MQHSKGFIYIKKEFTAERSKETSPKPLEKLNPRTMRQCAAFFSPISHTLVNSAGSQENKVVSAACEKKEPVRGLGYLWECQIPFVLKLCQMSLLYPLTWQYSWFPLQLSQGRWHSLNAGSWDPELATMFPARIRGAVREELCKRSKEHFKEKSKCKWSQSYGLGF